MSGTAAEQNKPAAAPARERQVAGNLVTPQQQLQQDAVPGGAYYPYRPQNNWDHLYRVNPNVYWTGGVTYIQSSNSTTSVPTSTLLTDLLLK